MKKAVIYFIFLISLSFISASAFAQSSVNNSVIKIISGSFDANRDFQRSLAGSGVIVDSKGLVITSRNVVFPKGSNEPFPEIWAGLLNTNRNSLRPNQAYRLRLMNQDEKLDLALLKIESTNPNQSFPAIQFGETGNLRYGQNLNLLGFMQSNGTSLSTAEVSFLDYDDNSEFLKFEGQFLKGIAGGAIVDKTGKLIGIPVMAQTSDSVPFFNQDGDQVGQIALEEIGTVLPVESIQEFLQKIPNLFSFSIPSDLRKAVTIEGSVNDKQTNQPIKNATIGILIPNNNSRQYIESDELIAYARTDERGSFKLNRKLKAGNYSVKVVHQDYKTEYKTIQIPTNAGRLLIEMSKEARIVIKK